MASSIASIGGEAGMLTSVPVLTPAMLMSLFPPPYDLIKIDIEGSEHAFVTAYEAVLAQARAVLLEWHSWHAGGGGAAQLRADMGARGFRLAADLTGPQPVVEGPLAGGTTGLDLFLRCRPS
jgi:hypothetical protein